MTLFNRIHRRLVINRTVRELSRLNPVLLNDIGLDPSNLTKNVEQIVDAGSTRHQMKATQEPVFTAVPVAAGTAA